MRLTFRVIYDASLDDLLQKVWDGKRIGQAEALRLYHLPLEELGALADRRRQLSKKDAYDGRGARFHVACVRPARYDWIEVSTSASDSVAFVMPSSWSQLTSRLAV